MRRIFNVRVTEYGDMAFAEANVVKETPRRITLDDRHAGFGYSIIISPERGFDNPLDAWIMAKGEVARHRAKYEAFIAKLNKCDAEIDEKLTQLGRLTPA